MAKREVFVSLNIQTEGDERLTEIVRRQRELKEENKATQKSYKELAAQLKDQTITLEQYNTSLKLNDASIARNRIELKALSGIEREATNDLSGLTEAGLRFRDKMADATLEAIKQSGAFAKIQEASERYSERLGELNTRLEAGEITQRQFTQDQQKLLTSIEQIAAASKVYAERLDVLKAKTDAGELSQTEFKNEVTKLTKEVGKFGATVEKVADAGIEALRTQLREAKADAQRLFIEFGRGSEEFQRAAARVDDLSDAVDEVNVSVEAIDFEGKIQVAGKIAQGITGGFQVATGAMALFGAESEDVQKALLKVQAAIAIGQGVDQLVQATKAARGFAIAIGLVSGSQKANAAATALATTATTAQGAATTTTTVATRALTMAMNAMPLVALLSAISAIGLAIALYSDSTEDAVKANAELIASMDEIRERNAGFISALKQEALINLELRKLAEGRTEDLKSDVEQRAEIEAQELARRIEQERKAIEELDAIREQAQADLAKANAEGNTENQKAALENDQNALKAIDAKYKEIESLEAEARIQAKQGRLDLAKFEFDQNKKSEDEGKRTAEVKVKQAADAAGSIAEYQKRISELQTQQSQSTSSEQFATYQKQIDDLQAELEILTGQLIALPDIRTVQFVADENTDAPEPPSPIPSTADTEARLESLQRAEDIMAEIRDRGLSDQERLTAELASIDAEYQAGRIESEEEYQALKADVAQREEELKAATIDATLTASADLFTALSEMAEDGSEEQKAFAVTAALINTYQGVTKALATLPPPASYIAAATTLVQGLQAVAKIQGFAVGGYTGDGARYEPAGIVHRGEYVFSKPAVERIGVDKLEAMHTDATGRSSPQVRPMDDLSKWVGRAQGQLMMAPFLEGGPVTTSLSLPRPTADQLVAAEIAVSLRNINLRPQVDVNTIRSAMSNVEASEIRATL